jgi:hypothetical protein
MSERTPGTWTCSVTSEQGLYHIEEVAREQSDWVSEPLHDDSLNSVDAMAEYGRRCRVAEERDFGNAQLIGGANEMLELFREVWDQLNSSQYPHLIPTSQLGTRVRRLFHKIDGDIP